MFCRTTWRYPTNPSEETQVSSAAGGEHLLPSSDPVSVQCLLQELQQAAPNSAAVLWKGNRLGSCASSSFLLQFYVLSTKWGRIPRETQGYPSQSSPGCRWRLRSAPGGGCRIPAPCSAAGAPCAAPLSVPGCPDPSAGCCGPGQRSGEGYGLENRYGWR